MDNTKVPKQEESPIGTFSEAKAVFLLNFMMLKMQSTNKTFTDRIRLIFAKCILFFVNITTTKIILPLGLSGLQKLELILQTLSDYGDISLIHQELSLAALFRHQHK